MDFVKQHCNIKSGTQQPVLRHSDNTGIPWRSISLNLAVPLLIPFPANAPDKQQTAYVLESILPTKETQMSAWDRTDSCRHLGSEPSRWKISFSFKLIIFFLFTVLNFFYLKATVTEKRPELSWVHLKPGVSSRSPTWVWWPKDLRHSSLLFQMQQTIISAFFFFFFPHFFHISTLFFLPES